MPAAAMGPRAVLLVLAAGCAALGAAEFSPSLDSDFTFTLPAGRRECFYQPMRKDASLELEYQVGGGGTGWRGTGTAGDEALGLCRGSQLPSSKTGKKQELGFCARVERQPESVSGTAAQRPPRSC